MKTTDLKIEIQQTFTAPAPAAAVQPNLVRFFVIARRAVGQSHFCSAFYLMSDGAVGEAADLVKSRDVEVAWVVRVELPPFD